MFAASGRFFHSRSHMQISFCHCIRAVELLMMVMWMVRVLY